MHWRLLACLKHAWRGVGAFYRKGDHIQTYETNNARLEYKALKMNPPWDKWIIPKPVLISNLVIEDFEAQKAWNFFEHYHDEFQPNTFPKDHPPSFQVDKGVYKCHQIRPNEEKYGEHYVGRYETRRKAVLAGGPGTSQGM